MAPSEDSETRRGGRVQVEEVVSNKVLLSLTAGEGLDDIIETGVTPWSYKQGRMEFKTGGNTCWKAVL